MEIKQVEELLKQGILTPGKGAWIKYGNKNIGNGKKQVLATINADAPMETELLWHLSKDDAPQSIDARAVKNFQGVGT